jgi:plasmid maintenance system killer protein
VELSFANRKLAKELADEKAIVRNYGADNGRRICQRLAQLMAADNLETLRLLPQIRAHELTGDRAGQISVDVRHPYRLLLVPDHDETPRKPDGGLDWMSVTKVKILGIVDTH